MDTNLTPEEQEQVKNWVAKMEGGEIAQVQDLVKNCKVTFQFAKTHSTYVKDWENMKAKMEDNLKNGILPPGVSANLYRAIINGSERVMQMKLESVRESFQILFGESIYNYLGPDGKTKNYSEYLANERVYGVHRTALCKSRIAESKINIEPELLDKLLAGNE